MEHRKRALKARQALRHRLRQELERVPPDARPALAALVASGCAPSPFCQLPE